MMHIKDNSFNGAQIIPIESELMDSRMIFLEGEITSELANNIVKQIIYLSLKSNDPISLIINSPGGEIDAGMQICDAVSTSPCVINAYCLGQAYSMGCVIFESVNGKRYMIGHSKLMFHQPIVTALGNKTTNAIVEISKQMNERLDLLLDIICQKSGVQKKFLLKEIQTDRYFDSKEAISLNMADECIGLTELLQNK